MEIPESSSQVDHKPSQVDPKIPLEQTPPEGGTTDRIGNIDQVPAPEIIEEEAAGGNENLKPNVAPASEEGNQ